MEHQLISRESSSSFLALPAELRIQIAEYAFEQCSAVWIPHTSDQLRRDTHSYRPSESLALLLVCRQLHSDFIQIAYNKTTFVLWTERHVKNMHHLPLNRLRNLRRLAFRPTALDSARNGMGHWENYFYNLGELRLDELVFLWGSKFKDWFRIFRTPAQLLRRLQHVRTVKFVLYAEREGENKKEYLAMIGVIMKGDHFYRYDAPGGPDIEATWWDWHLNSEENIITFTAQEPRPVMLEEDYMLLMKPKVDALMLEAE